MSSDETDLIERLHAVAAAFEMPAAPVADDVWRGRRRVRRSRGLLAGAAAASVVVVLGVVAALGGQDRSESDRVEPAQPPGVVVGDVPVWWDARGLHRGDVVEETPVDIGLRVGEDMTGALALVRSGALYRDPATSDVWFHPWGGDPRVVGHDSAAGPGGDPSGDTAAWFEGSDSSLAGSQLVVYDTAAGREVSRTKAYNVSGGSGIGGEHYPPGNGFLQVSAERVVWTSEPQTYSHDVRTLVTTEITPPEPGYLDSDYRYLVDVHDGITVFGSPSGLVLDVPGQAERHPDGETHVRLSPSGKYLLGVGATKGEHVTTIRDIRTDRVWLVPGTRGKYPWIAWSYADVAMVDTEDALLACDAARRTCETLPAERPFLMPTN